MKRSHIKVLVTVAVVAGVVGYLIASSLGHAEYYKYVHDLMEEPDEWVGKTLRVHGYVEAGSINERIDNQRTVRTFVLENKGKSIVVHHAGPKPDTFKDLSEVVAKGRIVKQDGVYKLEAEELMAKCPSKYEGAPKGDEFGTRKSKNVF